MSALDALTPHDWDLMRSKSMSHDKEYAGPDYPVRPEVHTAELNDAVNPTHYKDSGIECVDYMKAISSPGEFRGYLWLSAIKYLHRWQKKGGVVDVKKAQWYLDRLITEEET